MEPNPYLLRTIIFCTIYIIVLCLTIFGNLFVILAFCFDRRIRNHSNALLVSLSFTDLLLGLLVFSTLLVNELFSGWIFGEDYCKFYLTSSMFLNIISSNHLVIIAIDRYQIVYEGVSYLQRRNVFNSFLIPVAIVWLIATWVITPLAVYPDEVYIYNSEGKLCRPNYLAILHFYVSLVFIVFPVLILILLYKAIHSGIK